jgi:hypothetical protein
MSTRTYIWVIVVGVVVWWLSRKPAAAPTASVTLGDPTVVGSGSTQLGNTDYLTTVVPPGTP